MKFKYVIPAMEVSEMESECSILAGSDPEGTSISTSKSTTTSTGGLNDGQTGSGTGTAIDAFGAKSIQNLFN